MNKEDDLMLMAQQGMCYDIIKQFLNTDLARAGRITGINVEIQDGYVNAEWKFGDRKDGDIKE